MENLHKWCPRCKKVRPSGPTKPRLNALILYGLAGLLLAGALRLLSGRGGGFFEILLADSTALAEVALAIVMIGTGSYRLSKGVVNACCFCGRRFKVKEGAGNPGDEAQEPDAVDVHGSESEASHRHAPGRKPRPMWCRECGKVVPAERIRCGLTKIFAVAIAAFPLMALLSIDTVEIGASELGVRVFIVALGLVPVVIVVLELFVGGLAAVDFVFAAIPVVTVITTKGAVYSKSPARWGTIAVLAALPVVLHIVLRRHVYKCPECGARTKQEAPGLGDNSE